jgi:hypothetical protein
MTADVVTRDLSSARALQIIGEIARDTSLETSEFLTSGKWLPQKTNGYAALVQSMAGNHGFVDGNAV